MKPHKGWKIRVADQPTPLIFEVLNAHTVWRWLTKPGRAALLSAKNGAVAAGHPLTLRTLRHHGLIGDDNQLTDAGKAVAKWCPPPKGSDDDSPERNDQ